MLMKFQRPVLVLALALATACGPDPTEPAEAVAVEADPTLVDQALLADLLGEAVEVRDDRASADGLLMRLAFEPLIRQSGPVQLQLVQGHGYRLLGVAEGAPLWQLGLREGDVLTSVDGQPILGREHELRSRWEHRPLRAEIGYQRDDQARTLSLRIRPGSAWRSSDASPPNDLVDAADPSGRSPVTVLTGSGSPLTGPELSAGIRCSPSDTADSIGRCEIERTIIDRLTANPGDLARQARIVPSVQDGVTRGYKLYGIRPARLASQLGLQNGDMIVAVDGQPLASLDAVMLAFTRLAKLDSFTLTLERRGATTQLAIAIVDASKPTPSQ